MLKTIYHHLARYRLFWILAMVVPPCILGTLMRYYPTETLGVLLGFFVVILAVIMWKVTGFLAEESKKEEN